MTAVIKHEISSYFSSLYAYIFGTFVLLFAGIYTTIINLTGGSANYEYVIGNMSLIFLFTIPVLTMRVISEERRQRTDQLLYSLPISLTKIVFGKYIAMLFVLLVPTAAMCIYPLILSAYGSIHLVTVYSTICGFFLLGGALLAIGMFISSVTDNQTISAIITFLVMLILYFMTNVSSIFGSSVKISLIGLSILALIVGIIAYLFTKSISFSILVFAVLEAAIVGIYVFKSSLFENLFPTIMGNLSIFNRFYTFAFGVFDVTGIIYYISIIALFLYMTVQSLEKRRWS